METAPGGYQRISSQAEITRKFQFPTGEMRQRENNAADKDIGVSCYAHGGHKESLKVKPMELILSRRNLQGFRFANGNTMGTGFTALNGLSYGDYGDITLSKEALLRSFDCAGISKTPSEDGDDNFGRHDNPANMFAGIGAGTAPLIPVGPDNILTGDVLVLDIPDYNAKSNAVHVVGVPQKKLLPFLRPFHKTDAKVSLLGIQLAMSRESTATNPGIKNLSNDAIKNSITLTPLQEEALGMRVFIKKAFYREGENPTNGEILETYIEKMDAIQVLADALTSAMMARFARIQGIALSNTKPGQTLSVMLSHYKVV